MDMSEEEEERIEVQSTLSDHDRIVRLCNNPTLVGINYATGNKLLTRGY